MRLTLVLAGGGPAALAWELGVTAGIGYWPLEPQGCLVFGVLQLAPQRPGQQVFALSPWLVLQSDHQFWAR